MAVEFKVGTFTGHNSASTQTVSGIGFTPSLVIVFSNYRTTTGNNNWYGLFGASDGTNNAGMGAMSEDAQGTSDADQAGSLTNAINFVDTTGALADTASINNFQSGSFDVVWGSDANALEYRYLAIGGISAAVGGVQIPTSGNPTDVSGLGFEPKAVIMFGGPTPATLDSSLTNINWSVGMADGTRQMVSCVYSRTNQATSHTNRFHATNRIFGVIGSGGLYADVSLASITSGGFTMTTHTSPGVVWQSFYIAIGGDLQAELANDTTPTGTAPVAQKTATSFQPTAALAVTAVRDTLTTLADDNLFGMGATDGTTTYGWASTDDDGLTTTDSHSHGNADFLPFWNAANSELTGASFTSFASDGVNLSFDPDPAGGYHFGLLALTDTPADSVTLTEIDDGRVFQRTSGSANITISGTYSGSPTNIEYRIVDDGTNTAVTGHDWQTLEAGPTGGTFSGTASAVPEGGWYNVDVRWSNDTGIVDNGANKFGVGIIVAVIGQSNGENWFTDGASPGATANDLLRQYNESGWATIGANADGAKSFGNSLITGLTTAVPVGLLDYCVGGSALRSEAAGAPGYWLDATGGEPYPVFDAAIAGIGDACEYVLWIQGEQDAASGVVTEAEYETSLTTFIGTLRGDVTNSSGESNLPFIVSRLGRGTDAGWTDDDFQAVRNAQADVVAAGSDLYFSETYDLALTDNIHYTNAAYITHGTRLAQVVLDILGEQTYHQGPAISNWSRVGTSVTVNLTHRGGSDFTPTTGITGFRFTDDGTPITIDAAVRTDATTVTLTLNSAPSGVEQLDYAYGKSPTISSVLLDDSALSLPLESIEAASVAPTLCAVTGTITSATETDIVAGGRTIVLTLTNDTWVAAGATFNAQRQNIIDGLDSAQAEATGWNAEVRDKEVVGAVVRTSDTVVTITLSAATDYEITADETITVTVPATALVTSASEIVATPTVSITDVQEADSGGGSGRLYSVDEWLELTRGPETEKTAQEAPQARIRDSSAKSGIKFDPEKRIESESQALEAIRERLLAQEAATGIAQAEIARIDAELEARQDDALLAVLLLVTLE